MKSKTIYLIRHGETDFNRQGIVQGSGVDSELNEWGIAQAEAFFDAYQHVPFDKIYTSALRRTIQSVQGFIDLGIAHESHAGLNEISWGCREGQTPNTMDNAYYRDLVLSWRSGQVHVPCEEGESPVDVRTRQKPVVDLILSRPHERTVLVAMHGRAIRILLTLLFDEHLTEMDKYEHSNLCLYRLKYLYSEQKFVLETANDITHLLSLDIPHNS
ncbi:histidine phosphatase family protein [Arundinibacter roseus]|uniref:Histidine phosphatase family protein n=1 Tax=Arundinibacter roseus TaxID=2070510 RepID=A0A4R4K9W2_9BACT|nr:histidine phosphatase family protein [Arundinibacter roseus]TDB64647.1 histidine phosphatase family protein [Arundinibacter roseus]